MSSPRVPGYLKGTHTHSNPILLNHISTSLLPSQGLSRWSKASSIESVKSLGDSTPLPWIPPNPSGFSFSHGSFMDSPSSWVLRQFLAMLVDFSLVVSFRMSLPYLWIMFRGLFHILQVLARVSFLNLMVYLFSLQCKYPLLVIKFLGC
jgi:hypothetical protein